MLRIARWLLLLPLLLTALPAHASAWTRPAGGAAPVPAAAAGTWLRPVAGRLLRAFALGHDPYADGWHRGVDLAAARGSPVRSACAGRVSFAGRVPRGGRTVSVRCGAIAATYQQLGPLAVTRRDEVARGALLGRVGRSRDPRQRRAHLHLGARELATGRYLDPLRLLGGAGPAVPFVPPAARTPPRAGPLGPAPASPRATPVRPRPASPRIAPVRPGSVPATRERMTGRLGPVAPQPGVPWPVWIGLACVGLGVPFGGFVRARRRRHAPSRVARTA